MKKKRIFINLILSLCFVAITANDLSAAQAKSNILGNRKPTTDSDIAILEIEKIVISVSGFKATEKADKGANKDADIFNSKIQNEIIQQVEARFPLNTNSKLEKFNLAEIEKKTDLEGNKKYPLTRENLQKKYAAQADEKFKAAQIHSKVTVEYQQGPYVHKVTGTYYGYTNGYDGIRVGRTVIPLIDLLPNEKTRFDNKFRKLKKESFINKNIAEYLSTKRTFAVKKIKASVKATEENNEEAGYIYAWQKWRTPKEVTEIIIKHYRNK